MKSLYENEMKLEFLSKSNNEAFARISIAAFAAQLDPTIEELADIKTAVSEAVTNSIIHGYEDSEGMVKIDCKIIGNSILIEIADMGKGIENIEEARKPLYTSKPNLERSGMGFTIMESFMDELKVESILGLGTKVTMKKLIKKEEVTDQDIAMVLSKITKEESHRKMVYENKIKDILDAQNGNQEKMTKLIEENNGLIWSIVKRFQDRGYELEDLYQIGCIGFVKSIQRFNSSFEVKLSTYAVPYILGEIKRFLRDDGSIKVSRSIKELAMKIRDLQNKYLKEKGKEITIKEMEEQLKVAKEEIALALDSLKPTVSIYEENYTKDEGGLSVLDTLSSEVDEAEQVVRKIAMKEMIESLEKREKQLILLRYYKNKTQMEVAKILGISQVQVSRIEKKILHSMKIKLAG